MHTERCRLGHFRDRVSTVILLAAALLLGVGQQPVHAELSTREVRPSAVDSNISGGDAPHLVIYDAARPQGKLLLFLPGTGGEAANGPKAFYDTAVAQGYRLVALSYIDQPAVAAVCLPKLREPYCAAQFRQRRVFGDAVTGHISDTPADAIVSRFRNLLLYLQRAQPDGDWNQYLDDGRIRWDQVALAGQSQGGGMAAFLAKKVRVARVIEFSGGWDNGGSPGSIASWYSVPSATPESLWYGTYHQDEPNARVIRAIYQASRIPPAQVFRLDQPVPAGKQAHPQGVSNPVYRPIWVQMLGSGT